MLEIKDGKKILTTPVSAEDFYQYAWSSGSPGQALFGIPWKR